MGNENDSLDRRREYFQMAVYSQYFWAVSFFVLGLLDPLKAGWDFTGGCFLVSVVYWADAWQFKVLPAILSSWTLRVLHGQ
jgi:hypothetical protein